MHRDPRLNADHMPLEADHTHPRALGGTHADRLMLATCNRSRGDGTRRRGTSPTEPREPFTSREW